MESSIILAIGGSLIGIFGAVIGVYVALKKEPKKKKEIATMTAAFSLIVLAHCCVQILASGPVKIYAVIAYGVALIGFIIYWNRKASQPNWNHSDS